MDIVIRAESLGITRFGRITHLMDVDYAVAAFGIDLNAWLKANDADFAHDFVGIANNIDRGFVNHTNNAAEICFNGFVPRFAGKEAA